MNSTQRPVFHFDDFGDSNLSPRVIEFLAEHVEAGARILEFGSGLGTRELGRRFELVSIEHDDRIQAFHERYVHSPLQEDLHYREEDCERAFAMGRHAVIVVDGPPAHLAHNRKSRLGFQKFAHRVEAHTMLVFDDVERPWDCWNFLRTFSRLRREVVLIEDGKIAGVLLPRPATARSYLGLARLVSIAARGTSRAAWSRARQRSGTRPAPAAAAPTQGLSTWRKPVETLRGRSK